MEALPFLEDVEQISLQALNLFCYRIAVGRVQTVIEEVCPMFFYWCHERHMSEENIKQSIYADDSIIDKQAKLKHFKTFFL